MSNTTQDTRHVLITGATSGIGRHAALELARSGRYTVIATGRNPDKLAELRSDAKGLPLDTLVLDVTRPETIREAVAGANRLTDGRGIDSLINNAGYGLAAPMAEVTDTDLRKQFDVNVFGLAAVTRAFVPQLARHDKSYVLNVSSVGGRMTFPFFGAYHATKYAVEALSDALRMELHPFGVRVVLIEPGPIDTGFADRTVDEISRYRSDDSPYAAVYARADAVRERSDSMAVGPEKVTRVIDKALRKRRPRARYVVPFTSQLAVWAMGLMPTRFRDWMLRKLIGLNRKHLGDRTLSLPASA